MKKKRQKKMRAASTSFERVLARRPFWAAQAQAQRRERTASERDKKREREEERERAARECERERAGQSLPVGIPGQAHEKKGKLVSAKCE